jgi:uncharacterized protein YvpB
MKIPYEKQHDTTGNRMCGAAAMAMVLRSLNQTCSQMDLWNEIKSLDGHGNYYGKSHKLALSFLNRGFDSICISTKEPIKLLKVCFEHSIRVILGHRLEQDSNEGHFTVFTKITKDLVYVNDPALGSNGGKGRKIPHNDLLELMNGSGEIAKNLCIAITNSNLNFSICAICNSPIIDKVKCANCQMEISLQPTFVCCQNLACEANLTDILFCPHCDMGLSFIS